METTALSQDQLKEVTTKGRYIASGQIGTKSAQLYLFEENYFVVWYKRSVNFVSIHKIEQVTADTAKMLFPV
jgi:hypothetical protein